VFTIELIMNMYGSWMRRFWASGWNIFDFTVVTIGLVSMTDVDLGPLRMLRMMRAFRVFRLFKKIESLNKIITSLLHAVPGMFNAFLIVMIFMCIYAALAVDLFGDVGDGCQNKPPDGTVHDIVSRTSRENCFGYEYYGNFAKSFMTFFQVLTGDSWSEAVVRPIMLYYDEPMKQLGAGIFFSSYILITAVVLINVVIAVLLDNMSLAPDGEFEPNGELPENHQDKHDCKKAESTEHAKAERTVDALKQEVAELKKSTMANLQEQRADMVALRTQAQAIINSLMSSNAT